MANYSFLIETDSAEALRRLEEPENPLSYGRNCIPVFWFSLFDNDCVFSNEIEFSNGEKGTYPYLITATSKALQRCLKRKAILQQITPQAHFHVVGDWINMLENIKFPYLHLDSAEVWAMGNSKSYISYIQNGLAVFTDSPPDFQVTEVSERWLEIFDVAQIDSNDLPNTVTPFKLIGGLRDNLNVGK